MTGGCVGESVTQRGEDVVKDEGKQSGGYDLPPQGQSQRPRRVQVALPYRRRSAGNNHRGFLSGPSWLRRPTAGPASQLSGAAGTPFPRDG